MPRHAFRKLIIKRSCVYSVLCSYKVQALTTLTDTTQRLVKKFNQLTREQTVQLLYTQADTLVEAIKLSRSINAQDGDQQLVSVKQVFLWVILRELYLVIVSANGPIFPRQSSHLIV